MHFLVQAIQRQNRNKNRWHLLQDMIHEMATLTYFDLDKDALLECVPEAVLHRCQMIGMDIYSLCNLRKIVGGCDNVHVIATYLRQYVQANGLTMLPVESFQELLDFGTGQPHMIALFQELDSILPFHDDKIEYHGLGLTEETFQYLMNVKGLRERFIRDFTPLTGRTRSARSAPFFKTMLQIPEVMAIVETEMTEQQWRNMFNAHCFSAMRDLIDKGITFEQPSPLKMADYAGQPFENLEHDLMKRQQGRIKICSCRRHVCPNIQKCTHEMIDVILRMQNVDLNASYLVLKQILQSGHPRAVECVLTRLTVAHDGHNRTHMIKNAFRALADIRNYDAFHQLLTRVANGEYDSCAGRKALSVLLVHRPSDPEVYPLVKMASEVHLQRRTIGPSHFHNKISLRLCSTSEADDDNDDAPDHQNYSVCFHSSASVQENTAFGGFYFKADMTIEHVPDIYAKSIELGNRTVAFAEYMEETYSLQPSNEEVCSLCRGTEEDLELVRRFANDVYMSPTCAEVTRITIDKFAKPKSVALYEHLFYDFLYCDPQHYKVQQKSLNYAIEKGVIHRASCRFEHAGLYRARAFEISQIFWPRGPESFGSTSEPVTVIFPHSYNVDHLHGLIEEFTYHHPPHVVKTWIGCAFVHYCKTGAIDFVAYLYKRFPHRCNVNRRKIYLADNLFAFALHLGWIKSPYVIQEKQALLLKDSESSSRYSAAQPRLTYPVSLFAHRR